MNEPLVSVIIPCWGIYRKYLPRCIKSVKIQTYKNIEILVITNKTHPNAACNAGLLKAKGKYVAFLGADDTWEKTKIEEQVEEMEIYPNCVLCTTWSKDYRFGKMRINKPQNTSTYFQILHAFNYSSGSTYMIRNDGGLERFDETLASGQEYDLALRLLKIKGAIAICIPKILMTQYSTDGQISTDWSKKIKGIKQLAKKHGEEYDFKDWIKSYGLRALYYSGFIFGTKIYKLITYMKERHE